MKKDREVVLIARAQVALVDSPRPTCALRPTEVEADTIVSWISSGSEIFGNYLDAHYESDHHYPRGTGYMALSRVCAVGSEVEHLKVGDLVLGGSHRSWQRGEETFFIKVPDGMAPEVAIFGRVVKVSLPAFIRTEIRPPEKCMIVGLGMGGFCAAQLSEMLGYETFAFDTNPVRREIAEQHGINVVSSLEPFFDKDAFSLGIDCTGNELAVCDLCRNLRRFGEISLVGVPWIKHSDLSAQEILHPVFYRFLTIRTGWENDMPNLARQNRIVHTEAALRYLQKGLLRVDPDCYEKVSPENPQVYYQNLLQNRTEKLGYLFDWRLLEGK